MVTIEKLIKESSRAIFSLFRTKRKKQHYKHLQKLCPGIDYLL